MEQSPRHFTYTSHNISFATCCWSMSQKIREIVQRYFHIAQSLALVPGVILDSKVLRELNKPLPALGEETADVREVFLASRGVNDGLNRDAEEREGEDEDKSPEYGLQHGRGIIQQARAGGTISACRAPLEARSQRLLARK